jgi:hypothetical protein
MIELFERDERRHFFHRKDSFSRRIARGIPGIGGFVDVIPEFGRGRRDAAAGGGAFPARGQPCPVGFGGDGRGNCVPNPRASTAMVVKAAPGPVAAIQRFIPGGATGLIATQVPSQQRWQAIMGQFGVGTLPESKMIDRAICPRGMVIATDGVCYNRRSIRNSDREWPRGTRPLGTPGEMHALRVASRFAGRMDRTNERLQHLGLLKRPTKTKRKRLANPKH